MSKTKKTFTVYKGTYSRPEPVEVEVLCENGTLVAHPAISTETSKQPIVITHKPTGCAIGSTHKVGNAASFIDQVGSVTDWEQIKTYNHELSGTEKRLIVQAANDHDIKLCC